MRPEFRAGESERGLKAGIEVVKNWRTPDY